MSTAIGNSVKSKRVARGLLGIVLVLVVATLIAVSSSRRLRAYAFCTLNLQHAEADSRILQEDTVSGHWVATVQGSLDRAIKRVESVQGRPFAGPVRVCLCATQRSYNRRTGDPESGRARGAVFANRVFLSPRCLESSTTEAILTHELSHLHFRQLIGTEYVTGIPGWFQEGLAVHVARGGGAEPISRQAAIAAIKTGRSLDPEDSGSSRPRMAVGHGLQHHMFYRQSQMFVESLATDKPVGFEKLMDELFAGHPFGESFQSCLGGSPKQLWSDYCRSL